GCPLNGSWNSAHSGSNKVVLPAECCLPVRANRRFSPAVPLDYRCPRSAGKLGRVRGDNLWLIRPLAKPRKTARPGVVVRSTPPVTVEARVQNEQRAGPRRRHEGMWYGHGPQAAAIRATGHVCPQAARPKGTP